MSSSWNECGFVHAMPLMSVEPPRPLPARIFTDLPPPWLWGTVSNAQSMWLWMLA